MARQSWMDGIRGACVLAVVLLHAELVVAGVADRPVPTPLTILNTELEPCRMPLLVLLSGLLLPRSLAKGARHHVEGKLRALAWPYAVWAALDGLHLTVHVLRSGGGVPWDFLGRLAYDPPTYLWFLAYLFVFHLLATPLPATVRTLAGPCLVLAADLLEPGLLSDPELHRFVSLLGWFLVGDLLARLVGPRVPVELASAVGRVRWGVLASVGRSSVVYYACHLLVSLLVVELLVACGVRAPLPLLAAAIGCPLLAGAGLVRARRHRAVDLLFRLPRPTSAGTGRIVAARQGLR
ncbi:acyltransferase family protein [Nocardioides pacificus]